jgi:hypothetical protein
VIAEEPAWVEVIRQVWGRGQFIPRSTPVEAPGAMVATTVTQWN